MPKKVIILIAVRLKSKRLEKKALLKIFDQPMILFLVKRLKRSTLASEIYLCTSINKQDDKISLLAMMTVLFVMIASTVGLRHSKPTIAATTISTSS